MRIAVCNPLSLTRTYRALHVATALKSDVALVPGTGLKGVPDCNHVIHKINKDFWCIHFGWVRGPFTNSSAGCSIFFRRQLFSELDVTSIRAPEAGLAGRAGLVRFKNKIGDFTFMVQYSSPLAGNRKKRAVQVKTNTLLHEWSHCELALAYDSFLWRGLKHKARS